MGFRHFSYYVTYTQQGSNVPGKVDANPYLNMNPPELKQLYHKEQDPELKAKMNSALRQLQYPLRLSGARRVLTGYRQKCAEIGNPAINLDYYQDSETDQGQEEIIDSLRGLYDNDNAEKFDYSRQGIRPIRDIDIGEGNFLTPTESPLGGPVVKERGDGPDPINLEIENPPTGGDNYDDVFTY